MSVGSCRPTYSPASSCCRGYDGQAASHGRRPWCNSELSDLTGLPLGLVRQQLFDALLLPPPLPPTESTRLGIPTPPRRISSPRGEPPGETVSSRGRPWDGEDTGLGGARAFAASPKRIDPTAILIVTFSNRAAGELVERLAAANPEEAPRLWIGTIHAFGLDLDAPASRPSQTCRLNPTLFDRSDAIEILQEKLPTLPLVHYRNLWDPALVLRDVVAAISRAKDELADPARYRSLAEAMRASAADEEGRVAAEKCLEIAGIYEIYERALQEKAGVDFGDLIMPPRLCFSSRIGESHRPHGFAIGTCSWTNTRM